MYTHGLVWNKIFCALISSIKILVEAVAGHYILDICICGIGCRNTYIETVWSCYPYGAWPTWSALWVS